MWQSVIEAEIKNSISVVIDVFRASNTIISALGNGANEVLPVTEITLAWELKEKHPDFLLGGERNSQIIKGFDFGNSPLEYNKSKVEKKTIILTTSNGTNALKKVEKADNVFVASFANCNAVARKLDDFNRNITIVCAGTLGTPSLEDTLAAGKIIAELKNINNFTLNDYGHLALGSYQNYQGKTLETILMGRNGLRLQSLEKMEDIKHCALENITEIIPEYTQNKIWLYPSY
ncbi:MAG: hypothetical protein JM58_01930 [Peptococcaceae bacterium BICA1-8]|nr:MAG: hypothetical protein JM58_01930 [Peptococcaceae bacterium BICA1-8]